jgi:hypothetical protein
MTESSQLPHQNSVAPLHEKARLNWLSWYEIGRKAACLLAILWSWINTALVSNFVWGLFDSMWYYRRGACDYGRFPYDLVLEMSPSLIALNLFIWASFVKRFPRHVSWVKLPALLAIVVWCGIVFGILAGTRV